MTPDRVSRRSVPPSYTRLVFACKSEKNDDAPASSSDEPLASGEHKGRRELPPAALDACQGKGVGDECRVQLGDKRLEAKCAALPDGRVACQPEHGEHRRPEGS